MESVNKLKDHFESRVDFKKIENPDQIFPFKVLMGKASTDIETKNTTFKSKVDKTIKALQSLNHPPEIFQRRNVIVSVNTIPGDVKINEIGSANLMYRASAAANYTVSSQKGKSYIDPPQNIIAAILEDKNRKFPELEGITEIPVFRHDGSLVLKPGYDKQTCLYYSPSSDLVGLSIDPAPSDNEIKNSIEFLRKNILDDFLFADNASYCNAFAMLITPFLSGLYPDKPLMCLIDGSKAGVGKGLLTDVIVSIASGRPAAKMQIPSGEDEMRKLLFANFLKGSRFLIFDNVRSGLKIDSSSLCTAITDKIYSDRVLSKSKIRDFPANSFIITNGNNLSVGGDLPRRCFWVKLQSVDASPHIRCEFTHSDLLQYISENRSEIIKNILTLISGWIVADRPEGSNVLPANVRGWAKTVGGILEFAGMNSFLGNYMTDFENSDIEGNEIALFLSAMYDQFSIPVVCSDIIKGFFKVENGEKRYTYFGECLPESFRDFDTKRIDEIDLSNFSKRFGKKLSNIKNAWYRIDDTEYRIVPMKSVGNNAIKWKVEKQ